MSKMYPARVEQVEVLYAWELPSRNVWNCELGDCAEMEQVRVWTEQKCLVESSVGPQDGLLTYLGT